jgi:hypothetical protein
MDDRPMPAGLSGGAAAPVVDDADSQRLVLDVQVDRRVGRLGVADHVGEGFAEDSEGGGFDGGRNHGQSVGHHLERHPDRHRRGVSAHGVGQARSIQDRSSAVGRRSLMMRRTSSTDRAVSSRRVDRPLRPAARWHRRRISLQSDSHHRDLRDQRAE